MQQRTIDHILDSRQWLQRAGGQGFHAWALEWQASSNAPVQLQRMDTSAFLGKPNDWRESLEQWVRQSQID